MLVFGFLTLILGFGSLGVLAFLLGSGTVHSKIILLEQCSGVFRGLRSAGTAPAGCPRARGDIPLMRPSFVSADRLSPCKRGYSLRVVDTPAQIVVVPVHAGVFPKMGEQRRPTRRCPRARGGIPYPHHLVACQRAFSPHKRGYSLSAVAKHCRSLVVPVNAGVFRSQERRQKPCRSCPRERGSTPASLVRCWPSRTLSPQTRGYS